MHEALLAKLKPDPDALLTALSQLMDDSMLQELAIADYAMDADKHLAELRKIRDQGTIHIPIEWIPGEVLALTRWGEPDHYHARGTENNLRCHIIRAFACAALLRSGPDSSLGLYSENENQTLAQLLASLAVIVPSLQDFALRFVAWRAQTLPEDDEESPFFVLALLVLALKTHASLTLSEFKEIIDWLFISESKFHTADHFCSGVGNEWLLGLTGFSPKHFVWRSLGAELDTFADNYPDPNIRDDLKLIASELAENPQSSSKG